MTGIRVAPASAPLYVGAIPPGIQVTQSGATASPLLTDLVAYWKLDEPNGTRFDSVGTNNLSETGSVGSTIGIQGNAADFDGTNYLSTALDGTTLTAVSIALWFKADDILTANVEGVLSWARTGIPVDSLPFIIIQTNSGTTRLYADGNYRVTSGALANNTWYHVVCTYDGTDWKMYLDGGLIGTYTGGIGTNITNANTVYVGSGFNNQFPGDIDEVGIWDRALEGSEITTLYNGGSGITYPFT
jgi:hypothetical protein